MSSILHRLMLLLTDHCLWLCTRWALNIDLLAIRPSMKRTYHAIRSEAMELNVDGWRGKQKSRKRVNDSEAYAHLAPIARHRARPDPSA